MTDAGAKAAPTGGITGQLIIRDTSARPGGRRVVLVVGVLAVPDGADIPAACDHQFVVAGTAVPGGLRLTVLTDGAVPTGEIPLSPGDPDGRRATGLTAGQLLTAPIWRV